MFQQEHSRNHVPRISKVAPVSEPHVIRKFVSLAAKFIVMGAILFYLYSKGLLDFSKMRNVFQNPVLVCAGFGVLTMNIVLAVFRWKLLLKGQCINIGFAEAMRLTCIGMFFNTALPGAVSGDVVKGYYIVRQQPDGKGKSKAFATLLFDRILGVSALVFVSFVAMVLNRETMMASSSLRPLAGLISLLTLGVIVFYAFVLVEWSFAERLNALLKKVPAGEILSKLFEAVKCYESDPLLVVKGFLLSVVIHTSVIALIMSLSQALEGFSALTPSQFFLLTPLGLLVTAIPIAPAGLGTGHAAFFGLFQMVGASRGADLFTAFVAFQILLSLTGGIVYVRYKQHHK